MALVKIADLYPNYKEDIFGGNDIKSFSVYDDTNDKVGSVEEIIVDESGQFRYLVIDTGFWVFGKKVLLPVGKVRIDYNQERIYANGLTKDQVENLPEYNDGMTIDYDYEERVRNVYRGGQHDTTAATTKDYSYNRDTYTYDHEPHLYAHQETAENKNLKLYEERLVANKDRFRTGTVKVGKKVKTETANVSVPVEKERVVIERTSATDSTPVTPGATAFKEGEVARVDVYEESANIGKEAFVREEVNVRKEVERDTVSANETIRREELDTDGEVVVKNHR